ncbi:hypothetical protein F5Y14DRAFT_447088 [Nemania sp. NC0429]|nr:hypothetical protein F5Y14DRAFT_447088 [Nemania sp. NC0429]
MSSLKIFTLRATALLLLGAQSAAALPSPSSGGNIQVYVRDPDFAYHPSEEMAHTIRARNAELSLEKRSHATVQACYTASCTDCHTLFDGDFVTSSSCISATSTACLIISNLDDANIVFWNHGDCDGNMSTFDGCPAGANNVGAPGTNSIGVHTGC